MRKIEPTTTILPTERLEAIIGALEKRNSYSRGDQSIQIENGCSTPGSPGFIDDLALETAINS